MKLLAHTLLLSAAATTACGIETGNGLVTARTGAKLGLISGGNTTNGFTGNDAQGTLLSVDSAHAYVQSLEFERTSGEIDPVDGPFAADLITRTAEPSLADLALPPETYQRIHVSFTQEKPSDGVVPANSPLAGRTLTASGMINYPVGSATPFDLSLRFNAKALFAGEKAISVDEETEQDIFLDLDVQAWFATLPITQCLEDGDLEIEDGRITIRDKGMRCKDIEKSLRDTIRASSKLRSK